MVENRTKILAVVGLIFESMPMGFGEKGKAMTYVSKTSLPYNKEMGNWSGMVVYARWGQLLYRRKVPLSPEI